MTQDHLIREAARVADVAMDKITTAARRASGFAMPGGPNRKSRQDDAAEFRATLGDAQPLKKFDDLLTTSTDPNIVLPQTGKS